MADLNIRAEYTDNQCVILHLYAKSRNFVLDRTVRLDVGRSTQIDFQSLLDEDFAAQGAKELEALREENAELKGRLRALTEQRSQMLSGEDEAERSEEALKRKPLEEDLSSLKNSELDSLGKELGLDLPERKREKVSAILAHYHKVPETDKRSIEERAAELAGSSR